MTDEVNVVEERSLAMDMLIDAKSTAQQWRTAFSRGGTAGGKYGGIDRLHPSRLGGHIC